MYNVTASQVSSVADVLRHCDLNDVSRTAVESKYRTLVIITVITVNLYRAFFFKKNPKRAACASLVEREEKGFEVALKRRKRKTIVSKVSRK